MKPVSSMLFFMAKHVVKDVHIESFFSHLKENITLHRGCHRRTIRTT